MGAQIIDGKKIAELVRAEWKLRAEKLIQSGIKPGLAVIIVGDNAASGIYVRNKVKACSEVGIYSEVHSFPCSAQQSEVLNCIQSLNENPHIHGILVQLPLPIRLSLTRILRIRTKAMVVEDSRPSPLAFSKDSKADNGGISNA